jgi:hypothetical protein
VVGRVEPGAVRGQVQPVRVGRDRDGAGTALLAVSTTVIELESWFGR